MTGESRGSLAVADLRFRYRSGADELFAGLTHTFPTGRVTVITGQSGRGKSTLLYILGLMLTPSPGHVSVDGRPGSALPDAARSRLRAHRIGFVFQDSELDPSRTVIDAVVEPGLYAGGTARDLRGRAHELLRQFDLGHRADHRPGEVSGGQAQRVAMCRALMNEPDSCSPTSPPATSTATTPPSCSTPRNRGPRAPSDRRHRLPRPVRHRPRRRGAERYETRSPAGRSTGVRNAPSASSTPAPAAWSRPSTPSTRPSPSACRSTPSTAASAPAASSSRPGRSSAARAAPSPSSGDAGRSRARRSSRRQPGAGRSGRPVGNLAAGTTQYPVVGEYRARPGFDDLATSAVVNASTAPSASELRVVLRTIAAAPATQTAVLSILAPSDPAQVAVESPVGMAALSGTVDTQLAGFGRSLMLLILGAGGLYVGAVVLSDLLVRRRNLGRRRTLGATRTDLTTLVTLRSLIPAFAGAVLGSAIARLSGLAFGMTVALDFTIAVATLATLTAALAAVAPASYGAALDPVSVMRTP